MNENHAENYARKMLEAHGFLVKRLEQPEVGRSADYLVESSGESFLIEVTDKKETDFLEKLLLEVKGKGVATGSREQALSNRIDGILRDKEDQLGKTLVYSSLPKVLWMSALNKDSRYILDLVKKTIYGIQTIAVHDSSGEFSFNECFYINYSSFYKYKGIDALVLASYEGVRLCLNEFSNKYNIIRASKLAEMFPEKDRVDPRSLEETGRAFCIRSDISRKDSKSIWKYLFKEYGVRTSKALSSNFVGYLSVPVCEDYEEQ